MSGTLRVAWVGGVHVVRRGFGSQLLMPLVLPELSCVARSHLGCLKGTTHLYANGARAWKTFGREAELKLSEVNHGAMEFTLASLGHSTHLTFQYCTKNRVDNGNYPKSIKSQNLGRVVENAE